MAEVEKIDLSGDGGALKELIKEGTGDELPSAGCKVSMHYTGRLTDGTVFDSSVDRGEPFEFALGKGQVIKAFDLGVASMKLGEKCKITCAPDYAYGATGSPPRIPPNATLIFELEMLGWKGEDISPNSDGSIERIVLEPSDKRRTPNDGALVKIQLKGKYEGKVFEEREVQFNLGEGSEVGVVEGVEVALEKIAVGETSKLTIKSKYAFGEKGNEAFNIPAKATVVYEVKLLECEKAPDAWKLSDEERLEQSKLFKQKGTNYFSKENFPLAIKMYKKCIDILPPDSEHVAQAVQEESKTLKIAANGNLALCYQKTNEDFEAKQACNEVLKRDANNIKALFRRGRCNLAVNDYTDALKDFQKVLELEPSNKAALNQIGICKQKIKESSEREKRIYANMFTKMAAADNQPEPQTHSDVLEKCGEWTEEDTKREVDWVFERDNNIVMI